MIGDISKAFTLTDDIWISQKLCKYGMVIRRHSTSIGFGLLLSEGLCMNLLLYVYIADLLDFIKRFNLL